MNRVWNYFEMARKFAIAKDDRRTYRIGCIAIRNDGAIIRARNEPTKIPTPYAHAEARASTRIDHGATIYVARVKKDGEFGMAKPCIGCQKFLRSKKIKRVYFTTGPTSYHFMDLL